MHFKGLYDCTQGTKTISVYMKTINRCDGFIMNALETKLVLLARTVVTSWCEIFQNINENEEKVAPPSS